MNTKIISVGGAVLVLLAVLLVGNMVVNTTPSGVAKTNYEYKIIPYETFECRELRTQTAKILNERGIDRDDHAQEMDKVRRECWSENLNKEVQDGWELFLIEPMHNEGIFRKQR